MPSIGEIVRVYRELAEIYESQGQAQMRDRFLVLAADAALTAGRPEEAERLREVLLQHNPHHLLKPYANLGEALKSSDIRNYVAALRRSHPYERAEHLLETLTGDDQEENGPKIQKQPEELKVFRVSEEPKLARVRTEIAAPPLR